MKKIVTFSLVLMLPACSIFKGKDDDGIVFDTVLGPVTEQQVKSLPNTLEGDSANARYMASERKGQGMESPDGTNRDTASE